MKCPECGRESPACRDSRPSPGGRRRRYHCQCGARFTTIETLAQARNGYKAFICPEEFNRWRADSLDEIETSLATLLADIRRRYRIVGDAS